MYCYIKANIRLVINESSRALCTLHDKKKCASFGFMGHHYNNDLGRDHSKTVLTFGRCSEGGGKEAAYHDRQPVS